MTSPLRIAVAGLGRIGRLHAELLASRTSRARLAAVMDVIEELARPSGERLGVPWYTDYTRLLENRELDAVVIATPTFLHRDMILQALEAGLHVMVEKPLTVTSKEAEEVVNKVRSKGLKLQVGYMRRFDPSYEKARKAIEEGRVGKPLSYVAIARDPQPPGGWAVDPSKSGGIVLDMLSHDTDMARWLRGAEGVEVSARGEALMFDHIRKAGDLDFAEVLLRFDNGAYGFIQGVRKSAFGYDLRTEVYGTEGTVYVETRVDNTLAIATREGVSFQGLAWFEQRFLQAYVRELEAFAESIAEDKKPPISEVDGYRAVKIGEACWQSHRENKPVRIEYDF